MADKPFSKPLGGDRTYKERGDGGKPDVASGAANRQVPRTNLGPDAKFPNVKNIGGTPDIGPSQERHV
jgi:hypothetical protein